MGGRGVPTAEPRQPGRRAALGPCQRWAWSPGHQVSAHSPTAVTETLPPSSASAFEMRRPGGELKPTLSDSPEWTASLEQVFNTVTSTHQALGTRLPAQGPRTWVPHIPRSDQALRVPPFEERGHSPWEGSGLVCSCPLMVSAWVGFSLPPHKGV